MNDTVQTPKKERKTISETASEGNNAVKGALTVIGGASAVQAFDLSKFKIVREVAVPQLSIKGDNAQLAVKIMSAMVDTLDAKGKPVTSAKVIDLIDGSTEKSLVIPAIVKSELTRTYPQDGYVGKFFAMSKLGRQEGKNYNNWDIKEIGQE